MAGIKLCFLYTHNDVVNIKEGNYDLVSRPLVCIEKEVMLKNLSNINSTFTTEYGGSI